MRDTMSRLEGKLDKQSEDIGEIKSVLAANTVSLQEHMRRTALLEEAVKPLRTRYERVNGVLKLLGGIVAVAAVVEAGVMLIEFLHRVK